MNVISPQTRVILALSMLKGVGPAALKKVAGLNRSWELPIQDVGRAIPSIGKALEADDSSWERASEQAEQQIEAATKHHARILSPLDVDYPQLLLATKDDPFLLYVKGSLAKDPTKSVAIIGTREPTPTGEEVAKRITQVFVEQGWSIVSGLAIGCDAIAHKTALKFKGHTVAVLAHGLQTIAPTRHKGLAQEILDAGGALVSEYRFGQDVQPQQYVKRDRTQAGLAQGVVMIQSDVKGGSLHASRAALDYTRWLAVPYPTPKDLHNEEPKVQGNLLIADGPTPERASLLRCTVSALDRVRVLRDRHDILRLAGAEAEMVDREDAPDASHETHGASPVPHVEQANASPGLAEGPASSATWEHDSEHSLPTRVHAQGVRHYYVALKQPLNEVDLNIDQIATWRAHPSKWPPGTSSGHSNLYVVFFTRLEHLQERLLDVKRLQSPAAKSSDATWSLHVRYAVEDVMTHMKRSLDDLAKLEPNKSLHASVEVPVSTQLHQQVALMQLEQSPSFEVDLVYMVDRIVESLPLSVAIPAVPPPEESELARDGEVDVSLGDLVSSFNSLVNKTLDERLGSH